MGSHFEPVLACLPITHSPSLRRRMKAYVIASVLFDKCMILFNLRPPTIDDPPPPTPSPFPTSLHILTLFSLSFHSHFFFFCNLAPHVTSSSPCCAKICVQSLVCVCARVCVCVRACLILKAALCLLVFPGGSAAWPS